jgi:hypothetical protein
MGSRALSKVLLSSAPVATVFLSVARSSGCDGSSLGLSWAISVGHAESNVARAWAALFNSSTGTCQVGMGLVLNVIIRGGYFRVCAVLPPSGDLTPLTHTQLVDKLFQMSPKEADQQAGLLMSRLHFASTYAFSKVLCEHLVDAVESPDPARSTQGHCTRLPCSCPCWWPLPRVTLWHGTSGIRTVFSPSHRV